MHLLVKVQHTFQIYVCMRYMFDMLHDIECLFILNSVIINQPSLSLDLYTWVGLCKQVAILIYYSSLLLCCCYGLYIR